MNSRRPLLSGGHPSSEIRTDDEDEYLDDVAEEELSESEQQKDQEDQSADADLDEEALLQQQLAETKPRKKLALKAPKPRAKLDITRYNLNL